MRFFVGAVTPFLKSYRRIRAAENKTIPWPAFAELMSCSYTGSGDADESAPTGDSSDGLNQPHDEAKSSGPIGIANSNYWRDVRANLVRREQVSCIYS